MYLLECIKLTKYSNVRWSVIVVMVYAMITNNSLLCKKDQYLVGKVRTVCGGMLENLLQSSCRHHLEQQVISYLSCGGSFFFSVYVVTNTDEDSLEIFMSDVVLSKREGSKPSIDAWCMCARTSLLFSL